MVAQAPLSIAPATAPATPEVACTAGDGCSYLQALSTIERIAGFEHAARRYAAAAVRCRAEGCPGDAPKAKAPAVTAVAALPLKVVAGARSFGVRTSGAGAGTPIPFSRTDRIDALSDGEGNFIERRPLKPDALPVTADGLGYLYRYWAGLRGAGALQFSSIDTVHLTRAGVIGSMHVVDVSGGDPDDFRFDLVGYTVPIGRYEKPRALPVSIYAQSTMLDYNTVRMTAAPRLHHVRCHLDRTSYHYTRLILPFLDADGLVDRLLVAIRKEPGDGTKL